MKLRRPEMENRPIVSECVVRTRFVVMANGTTIECNGYDHALAVAIQHGQERFHEQRWVEVLREGQRRPRMRYDWASYTTDA